MVGWVEYDFVLGEQELTSELLQKSGTNQPGNFLMLESFGLKEKFDIGYEMHLFIQWNASCLCQQSHIRYVCFLPRLSLGLSPGRIG
ncbi:MAG: hypothetical protein OHK0029_24660 [Armatimonadaceae bacterium]